MKGVNNMNSYHIKKHRINKLHIPETYDINKIQLGIPVTANEAAIVGLKDVGRILRTFKIKKNVEVTDNGKIII